MSTDLWIEKYRPSSFKEVKGSKKNNDDIIAWTNRWSTGIPTTQKALLCHGKPGTGKTSSMHVIAKEYEFNVVELNTSDVRTHSTIKERLTTVVTGRDMWNPLKKTLIILDEVDNLDVGADSAIIELIQKSTNPIVMTCNDAFSVSPKIREQCLEIQFNMIRVDTRRKILNDIAKTEGHTLPADILEKLGEVSDLRSAINSLQIYCQSGVLMRDTTQESFSNFQAIDEIFKTQDLNSLVDILRKADMKPTDAILWIEENLPLRYQGVQLFYAYKMISQASECLGIAMKTKNFRQWGPAINLMTFGVSSCKSPIKKEGFVKTEYPTYLKKMSATKEVRRNQKDLAEKLCSDCHCSKQDFIKNALPILTSRCNASEELLGNIAHHYQLTEKEVMTLLDTYPHDPRIKKVFSKKTSLSKEAASILDRREKGLCNINDFF
jgi:replication factor C large subunit